MGSLVKRRCVCAQKGLGTRYGRRRKAAGCRFYIRRYLAPQGWLMCLECGIGQPERAQIAVLENAQVPASESVGDKLVELLPAVVLADDQADAVEGRGFPQDREFASFAIELQDVNVVEAVLFHQIFERQSADRAEVGPVFADANRIGFVGSELCFGRDA